MPDIVISEFIDPEPVARLTERYSVHQEDMLWNRRDELEAMMAEAVAIIVRNRTQVNASLLASAPKLRVVGRMGVGLDNIDMDACKARGIKVYPAIGANAEAVADYVMASALMLLRRPAFFGTARLMRGEWLRQEMGTGREAGGKVMGLIGFGSIGQITAAKARGLGFRTVAADAFVPEGDPAWRETSRLSLPELLATADIVTLHCPLTPETRGLLGAEQIAAMKPGAILINSARGGIVEEAALAAALRTGHLGGAAIDVFDTEPVTPQTAELFAGLDNIILTPHIAGVTVESNMRVSTLTVGNVLKGLAESAA